MATRAQIAARLLEIKRQASTLNAQQTTKGGVTGADLAEEAAALGLEIVRRT